MLRLPFSILAPAKDDGKDNGGGKTDAKFVTVRVVCPGLNEGGQYYLKGATLQVTEDRAKALGPDHVEQA